VSAEADRQTGAAVSALGKIAQINVSGGGVPKLPVPEARVTTLGVQGDQQRDLRYHGGPERAVCLFPLERIHALQAEGHAIVPGAIGENITVAGIDWSAVVPGARLALGDEVLVEVTRYTSPCFKIKAAFKNGDFARVSQKQNPGDSRVYARVLRPGGIRAGDPIRLLP
jgi:MOSC domain-containing protein YiiM